MAAQIWLKPLHVFSKDRSQTPYWCVPNLKENDPQESCFLVGLIFLNGPKKMKNMKKICQFLGTDILQNTEPIFFKFGCKIM